MAILLLAAWSWAAPIASQTPARRERVEQVESAEEAAKVEAAVRQIRELQAQIDRLLLSLPLELRAVAEERLRSARTDETTTADRPAAAPAEAPPAERAPDQAAQPPETTTRDRGQPAVEPPGPASERTPEPSATPTPRETGDSPALATVRACSGLDIFDSNGDGVLSGADRYWRHFYLWLDDGDRQLSDREAVSVFEAGVRQIRLDLGGYTDDDGSIGLVDVADRVRFDLVGTKRRGVRSGILLFDADGLVRGDGPPLFDEDDAPLSGFQELRPGLRIGSQSFRCP